MLLKQGHIYMESLSVYGILCSRGLAPERGRLAGSASTPSLACLTLISKNARLVSIGGLVPATRLIIPATPSDPATVTW